MEGSSEPLTMEDNEQEEIDMSYEEFLIYSARLGELDDVKFCIDEKVDLATTDASSNTALRKFNCTNHVIIRHGKC